jgi:hypothetical protein
MDPQYFLSPGVRARARLELAKKAGAHLERLGDYGPCWKPQRFKRIYAARSEEDAVPYLRPYDVFEYLPRSADMLSRKRTKRLDSYLLHRGMLLQTCSGRNLGPTVAVDDYLAYDTMSSRFYSPLSDRN